MEILPQILLMVLTAFITSLVTKGKQNAEIEKIKAEKAVIDQNKIQGTIDMWQGLVEDLTKDVRALTKEVESLRSENGNLKFEMRKLEKILTENK